MINKNFEAYINMYINKKISIREYRSVTILVYLI